MKQILILVGIYLQTSISTGQEVSMLVWGDQYASSSYGIMPSTAQVEHGAKLYGIIMDGKAFYSVTAPDAGYGKIEIAYKNPMLAPVEIHLWDWATGAGQWEWLGTLADSGGVWTHRTPGYIALKGNSRKRFLGPGNEVRLMVRLPGGSQAPEWTLCYINVIQFLFYTDLSVFQEAVGKEERVWWEQTRLVVEGEGRAPDRIKDQAVRRAAAIRAGTVVAQRKLLELLQQYLPQKTGQKKVEGTLKGFSVRKIEELGDGRVRVQLEYPWPGP
jgi:hypothetical protein